MPSNCLLLHSDQENYFNHFSFGLCKYMGALQLLHLSLRNAGFQDWTQCRHQICQHCSWMPGFFFRFCFTYASITTNRGNHGSNKKLMIKLQTSQTKAPSHRKHPKCQSVILIQYNTSHANCMYNKIRVMLYRLMQCWRSTICQNSRCSCQKLSHSQRK